MPRVTTFIGGWMADKFADLAAAKVLIRRGVGHGSRCR